MEPQSKNSKSNPRLIPLVIGGVILLIIVLLILISLFSPKNNSNTTADNRNFVEKLLGNLPFIGKKSSSQSITLNGLEAGKRIAMFLDKTWKADSQIYGQFVCFTSKHQCAPDETSITPHTGQIILTYYELAKLTKDSSYKNKADTGINKALEFCKKDSNFCQWNFFPLYQYYVDTKDQKYKDGMLSVANALMVRTSVDTHVSSNIGVKYEMLYNATKDKRYKDALLYYADQIMVYTFNDDPVNFVVYSSKGDTLRFQEFRAIWSDLLPAYRLTKDPKYLDFAKQIVKRAHLSNHLDELTKQSHMSTAGIAQTKPTWATSSFLVIAWDAFMNLSQVDTGNKKEYQAEATAIGNSLVSDFMDTNEAKKYNGDEGILTFAQGGINTKDSLNNGWMARMFLAMKDQEFTSK